MMKNHQVTYAHNPISISISSSISPLSSSSPSPSPTSPPSWDPHRDFEGPWFQQQILLAVSIGSLAFLSFCLLRRKHPALFSPRTKLPGFSPPAPTLDHSIFSWIRPTIKAKEIDILHIVGLDAAVLLSFFKMSFWLFFCISIWSCAVLMPVNWSDHGNTEGVSGNEGMYSRPGKGKGKPHSLINTDWGTDPMPPIPSLPNFPPTSLYHLTHLTTTYVVTLLTLRFLYKNYHKFIRSRQLYALDLLTTIPARTVEVRNLPLHLRDDKSLAEYFEGMGFKVESTSVVRETRGLANLLSQRARALYQLERVWTKWLDNPTKTPGYDAEAIAEAISKRAELKRNQDGEWQGDDDDDRIPGSHARQASGRQDEESAPLISTEEEEDSQDPVSKIKASKPRPTMRLSPYNPFSPKVDAIDEMERRFQKLDRAVCKRRIVGFSEKTDPNQSSQKEQQQLAFKCTAVGYVTFVDASSAQIASQTVHYPLPGFCSTSLAPEPRDIVWSNVSLPPGERRTRQLMVTVLLFFIFVTYLPPLFFLASLLSPDAIKKYAPWLMRLLEKDERLKALVTNSLPSIVLSGFNALMPIFLEWSGYLQGLKSRSLVEYSVMKKYHVFLMVSVIFIFLITRTAWGVLEELAENPLSILQKFSQELPQARHFSLSYVILQSLATLPIQLLQLPVILSRAWQRIWTRTPREHAELNAPPRLFMGSVYPQALIIFTLCILYGVVSPLINLFGAIYFGIGYVVYKYKLMFVFYKSYESKGQAFPLSASRCIWALVLFQIFQLSLFSVRKQLLMSFLSFPLLVFTLWFGHHLHKTFEPLSDHVNLASIAEVSRSDSVDQINQISSDNPDSTAPPLSNPADSKPTFKALDRTQSINAYGDGDGLGSLLPVGIKPLMRRNKDPSKTERALSKLAWKKPPERDETLFVAERDKHTDYSQPPANDYFPGVLNTGRRRYGHPAITGVLPEPWLPVPELDSTANNQSHVSSSTILQQTNSASSNLQASEDPSSTSASGPVVLSLRLRKTSLLRKPSLKGLNRSASLKNQKARVASSASTSSALNPNERANASAGKATAERGVDENPNEAAGEISQTQSAEEQEAEEEEEEEEEEEGVYIHRSSTSQFSAV